MLKYKSYVTWLIMLVVGVGLYFDNAVAQDTEAQTVELYSDVYKNTRNLHVLLPPGYFDSENADRAYPVFYFTDGVAAWHMWGVPEVAKDLWEQGKIPPYIFVGIDNGGSTKETKNPGWDRASEYTPYADQTWVENTPTPKGKLFPKFLFEEVMPAINGRYRTDTHAAKTGLAGDSYAGAVSLYTGIQHPNRIGLLLLESPSLHIGNGQLIVDAENAGAWPRKVYIGVGTAEGDTAEIQNQMVSNVEQLHTIVENAADAPEVYFLLKEGAEHWYDAWRERLPYALESLLGMGGDMQMVSKDSADDSCVN